MTYDHMKKSYKWKPDQYKIWIYDSGKNDSVLHGVTSHTRLHIHALTNTLKFLFCEQHTFCARLVNKTRKDWQDKCKITHFLPIWNWMAGEAPAVLKFARKILLNFYFRREHTHKIIHTNITQQVCKWYYSISSRKTISTEPNVLNRISLYCNQCRDQRTESIEIVISTRPWTLWIYMLSCHNIFFYLKIFFFLP